MSSVLSGAEEKEGKMTSLQVKAASFSYRPKNPSDRAKGAVPQSLYPSAKGSPKSSPHIVRGGSPLTPFLGVVVS